MSNEVEVKRTVSSWKAFFKGQGDVKQLMLFKAYLIDKKIADTAKLSYKQINDGMTMLGNRCIHDTDKCLFNTRRDL